MKRLALHFVLLGLSSLAFGAELKHAAAIVDVRGDWVKDEESREDTLILNSKPEGRQIVVAVLRLKDEVSDLDQIVNAAAKIFEARLTSVQTLSPDVKFESPEVSNTESTILCVCRGFAPKEGVRIAIRIEGSAKTVRSTSVYDYTGMPADEFQKWSDIVLAGVK